MIKKLIKENTLPIAQEPKTTDYIRAIISGVSTRIPLNSLSQFIGGDILLASPYDKDAVDGILLCSKYIP